MIHRPGKAHRTAPGHKGQGKRSITQGTRRPQWTEGHHLLLYAVRGGDRGLTLSHVGKQLQD